MAIKDLYKEAKKEKENEVDDGVTMTLPEFIDEHTNLIKILRSGSKKELLAEADKQEKELKKYAK